METDSNDNVSTVFDQDPGLTKYTDTSVFDKYYEGIDLSDRNKKLKMQSQLKRRSTEQRRNMGTKPGTDFKQLQKFQRNIGSEMETPAKPNGLIRKLHNRDTSFRLLRDETGDENQYGGRVNSEISI